MISLYVAAAAATRATATPEAATGDEPPLNRPPVIGYDDRMRGMTALARVRKAYPGPAGELLYEAVQAWMDFGFRVDHRSVVPRLIAELTARAVER